MSIFAPFKRIFGGKKKEEEKKTLFQPADRTPFQPPVKQSGSFVVREVTEKFDLNTRTPFHTQISQANVPTSQKIIRSLPPIVEETRDQIREGLFGNQRDRDAGLALDSPLMRTRGLLPFLGRPQGERIKVLEDSLLRKGIDKERASQIATLDVLERETGLNKGLESFAKRQELKAEIDKLQLTKGEKRSIRIARLAQDAGSVLDATTFAPIGSIKVTGTTAGKIAKSTNVTKITNWLKQDIAKIDNETAEGLSKVLVNVKNKDDVQKVLNEVDFSFNKATIPERGVQTTARDVTELVQIPSAVKPKTFIGEAPEAFKPAPLTTKLLKKLEGKTTVSKQFISDLTNSPDLKQVEKDLIRAKLEGKGDKINVADFGKEVEAELLPLKVNNAREMYSTSRGATGGRYENITLPDELRGNVKNYQENIYESPIKTSAGQVHFGQPKDGVENYFGHTRIEDMADNSTRRVIEVQSDLFQKGNLDREFDAIASKIPSSDPNFLEKYFKKGNIVPSYGGGKDEVMDFRRTQSGWEVDVQEVGRDGRPDGYTRTHATFPSSRESMKFISDNRNTLFKESFAKVAADLRRLEQYNNPTAHFRMVREEIQKAAKDGKDKLQFPTGETAMKIEGLGETNHFYDSGRFRSVRESGQSGNIDAVRSAELKPDELKVGQVIKQGVSDDWIITDVLGDGKFKAVPKEQWEKYNYKVDFKTAYDRLYGYRPDTVETFDISGKVDTNNPIYKFYNKELQNYLKNNFKAQPVVDKQGVSWLEVPITKEMTKQPLEAFKIGKSEPTVTTKEAEKIFRQFFDEKEVDFFTRTNIDGDKLIAGAYRPSQVFKNPIVEVVQKNGKVDDSVVYHEAFHAFFNEFVPKAERSIILKNVRADKRTFSRGLQSRKVYKTPDARAEEWIADDFARFMQGKDSLKRNRNLYQRMLDTIRNWIRKATGLQKVYDDMIARRRDYRRDPARDKISTQRFKTNKPTSPSRDDGIQGKGRKDIEQVVGKIIPQTQSQVAKETIQELRHSEILMSLPASKQKSQTKSIAQEYALWKKEESKIKENWTKIRETAQDSFIRARKLQEKVSGQDVLKMPDGVNVDLAETLFHGRVHTRLSSVKEQVIAIDKDLLKTAKQLQITDDVLKAEVDSFLHARHAIERNAKRGDGASGISTKQAENILSQTKSNPHKTEIYRIAENIADINRQTLKTLLNAQVIDKELYKTLTTTYKHHVPLNRVMSEQDDIVSVLSAKGFDVKGTGIKKAVGSDREIADILTNVSANVSDAIVRAEKNLVDLTTLRFARKNKDLGLFEEIKPRPIGQDFQGKIITEKINDPTVLTLREKGKPVYLKINDPSLALALKGVNIENIPTLMRGIAQFTRLYSGLHTRFNYEFAFSNFVRDTQEMMVEVASRQGGKEAMKAAKRQLYESKKTVVDFLRGKNTEGTRLYNQMVADGGTTGGLSLSTREQIKVDIDKIRRLNRSKPRQAAVNAIQMIDNWNTIFEDASRLSVYKTALQNGVTRKKAAFLAKESTVNFNKKGTGTPIINGLYMFSNASIQGTTKVLRAMRKPKIAAAVVATVGTTVFAVNEWNDSVDKDWRNKISKFDRASNLAILLPTDDGTTEYITIPVSWGLKPVKISMEYLYDGIEGEASLVDATQGIITSIMESYNPLAGDEDILNTLTPTILKTPMEISKNRSWFGNQIRPEYDASAPNSTKYFKSLEDTLTGRAAIKSTAYVSEQTNGRIEVSPADVVYAFQSYIGGLGRSVEKIVGTITNISKGEPVPARERPILSRFFKQADEETTLQRIYYNEREKIDKEQGRQKAIQVRQIEPIYNEVQRLIADNLEPKAQAIVDSLSDEDYEIYKRLKASDKRRDDSKLQIKVMPVYQQAQELILQGNKNEAQRLVDELSQEEYEAYIKVKDMLGKSETVSIKNTYERSRLGLVSDYAKAFTIDAPNALRALLTKEKLGLVEGNLVELQRDYGITFTDVGGSQEHKRRMMASEGIPWSDRDNWKREHIVPVKAGGGSSDKNLLLVTKEMHDFFTPIDIAVGNAVRDKRITRKQATELMYDFKVYKTKTAEEVLTAIR